MLPTPTIKVFLHVSNPILSSFSTELKPTLCCANIRVQTFCSARSVGIPKSPDPIPKIHILKLKKIITRSHISNSLNFIGSLHDAFPLPIRYRNNL